MAYQFIRLARTIHVISACWILGLALIILIDVTGRTFFNVPFLGATEIIKNSVVSITFLQLPLAIYSGSMLKTQIVSDMLGPAGRRIVRTVACVLGAILFILLVYGAWGPMLGAWRIGEYEGEGAMRVPTYPVRILVVATSVYACIAYLMMIYFDWTGQLEDEESYPGAHRLDMKPTGTVGKETI